MKLTKKDTELLQEVTKGHTYKEIAKMMHVSRRTIEWRVQRIRQKTGAKNKIEVINYFNSQSQEGRTGEKCHVKILPDNCLNLLKRFIFEITYMIRNRF